ncbi:MAG: YtxH domain-containing protein [Alkalinema sp. CAN_BIN05]|nr:YtxH domain-containing protein [Alkalinema sp. CAN_BIN05]
MSNNRSGRFLSGILFGAAAGAIAGLLMAPRPGHETRRILKKSAEALPELADDLAVVVQVQTDRLTESAIQRWDDTLTRLKEAIAAGVEAGMEASQRISEADAPRSTIPDRKSSTSTTYPVDDE